MIKSPVDPYLEKNGWNKVYNEMPPRGESIFLGESTGGVFNYFETEITRPNKSKEFDFFMYKMKGQLFALRSDMYWKDG